MTKDDTIRMAREAGPLISTPFDVWCERFATLVASAVASAERESCAKLIEEYPYWLGTRAKKEIAAAIRGTT